MAKYDYTDEAGELLFQVVRYAPKGFRQRRPDGNGGWVWSLGNVRCVPYRLVELMEAVAEARPILIVEGEKDVESLRQLNVCATTNAGGAGKWAHLHKTTDRAWWHAELIKAPELCDQHFPDIRYVVPGLIPEGVTLLASRPKLGKSWLLLQIGSAMATGTITLAAAESAGSPSISRSGQSSSAAATAEQILWRLFKIVASAAAFGHQMEAARGKPVR